MKTEEIRECLGRCLTLTATQDNIYRGIVERSVTEARAELAALETAIAVKDETLAAVYRDTVGNAVADVLEETLVPGNKWFGTQGWMVFVKRHIAALRTIPAALTGSRAGAFVSLEQLRLIHRIVKMQQSLLSYWHHRGDTNCEESITIAHRDVSIDSERLIYSLDAKIKEAEDADN